MRAHFPANRGRTCRHASLALPGPSRGALLAESINLGLTSDEVLIRGPVVRKISIGATQPPSPACIIDAARQ